MTYKCAFLATAGIFLSIAFGYGIERRAFFQIKRESELYNAQLTKNICKLHESGGTEEEYVIDDGEMDSSVYRNDHLIRNEQYYSLGIRNTQMEAVGFVEFAMFMKVGQGLTGWIESLTVDSRVRRKGIGEFLVGAVLTLMAAKGIRKVSLRAEPLDEGGISQTALVNFYRKKFYFIPMNDANTPEGVVMARDLDFWLPTYYDPEQGGLMPLRVNPRASLPLEGMRQLDALLQAERAISL